MTKTGGRSASLRHIMGERALSVGMPRVDAPLGWKWVALTDVARLESGHTPSRKHREYWGGEVPWISIRDAKAHHAATIDETLESTNELGIANSSARILPAGTVCLSRTASVGYVVIMGRPMATSQDFVNWVCSEHLEPRFLQYLLIFEGPSLSCFSSGAVHQTIYFPEVKAFHICLPPPEEQRRIVAVLDKAFAAIAIATASAEKNLANARELLESGLQSTFIQEAALRPVRALGDVMRTGAGGTPLSGKKEFYTGGTIPWLLSGEVGQKEILAPSRYITEAGLNASSAKYYPENSVLVAMYGATAGQAGILRFQATSNQAVCAIYADEAFLPEYIYYFVRSQYDALIAQAVGNAQPNISQAKIKQMPLPVAALGAQERVVMRLNAILAAADTLTELQEQKLALLNDLRQSILHRAFAGELTERKVIGPAPSNDNFVTPEFAANVIAFAYWLHKKQNRDKSYKHVKAQKCLHNVESIAGIDLGRQPMKYQNGPHDPAHMRRTEDWAKAAGFFEFVPSTSKPGYDFKKLSNFDALWAKAQAVLKPIAARLEQAIAPLVTMNMEDAELFTTVHAAWNNLIRDKVSITDTAIIREARNNWDSAKLTIPEKKFRDAIKIIRSKNMIPDGSAKYVGGQASLF